MENTRYNGLAGKARRTRDLSRASRMYARQMVEEYLDPEPASWRRERYIPIRGRGEFLPSAAFTSDERSVPKQRQLELPLTAAAATEPSAPEMAPERTQPEPVVDPVPRDAVAGEPVKTVEMRQNSVIRPRRAPFRPMQVRKRPLPFTPRGFLFGCALGSAAAAMVLLVVQLAVR